MHADTNQSISASPNGDKNSTSSPRSQAQGSSPRTMALRLNSEFLEPSMHSSGQGLHLQIPSTPSVAARSLQMCGAKTPVSPPLSGPWHGRGSDSVGSPTSPNDWGGSSPQQKQPSSGRESPMAVSRSSSPLAPTGRHTLVSVSEASSSMASGSQIEPTACPEDVKTCAGNMLESAISLQQVEKVGILLQQGYNPNGTKESQSSPLILAAALGNERIVKALLAAGANINHHDHNLATPLHHAAAAGHRGVLKLLLLAGADLYAKTGDGLLPVQLTNDIRIRQLLSCRMKSGDAQTSSKVSLQSGPTVIEGPKQVQTYENVVQDLSKVVSSSTSTMQQGRTSVPGGVSSGDGKSEDYDDIGRNSRLVSAISEKMIKKQADPIASSDVEEEREDIDRTSNSRLVTALSEKMIKKQRDVIARPDVGEEDEDIDRTSNSRLVAAVSEKMIKKQADSKARSDLNEEDEDIDRTSNSRLVAAVSEKMIKKQADSKARSDVNEESEDIDRTSRLVNAASDKMVKRQVSTRVEPFTSQEQVVAADKIEGSSSQKEERKEGTTKRKSVTFAGPSDEDLALIRKDWHDAARAGCVGCGKEGCGGKCLPASKSKKDTKEPKELKESKEPKDSKEHKKSKSKKAAGKKKMPKMLAIGEPKTTGNFKWTKGELLGEGAYGKVFSGLNQSTGELMAVKEMKIEASSGQERQFYLASLQREIDLYKKLRHRHIVGYINMEQAEGGDSLYIFLEYVSGGSIQSMLERFGCFTEDLVRVYARQLLLGLEYLHKNKIVHRDIKGGNVLVDADGIVKLADFGASKAFQDPTVTDGCRSIRGSVFWMAPEVIKGDGYGRRADIWSVGCTIIEMLTATHPWPGIDNTWTAIFHIAKATSGPPIPDTLSDCGKDFLNKCFELDARKRPTSTELLQHEFVTSDADESSGSDDSSDS